MAQKNNSESKIFSIKPAGRRKLKTSQNQDQSKMILDEEGVATIVDNFKEPAKTFADAIISPLMYSDADKYISDIKKSLDLELPINEKLAKIRKSGGKKK